MSSRPLSPAADAFKFLVGGKRTDAEEEEPETRRQRCVIGTIPVPSSIAWNDVRVKVLGIVGPRLGLGQASSLWLA